jgi:hypothetical protein
MVLSQALQRRLGAPRILYAALVGSTVLLAVVAFVVPIDGAPSAPAPPMLVAMGVAALGAAVASFVVPVRLVSSGAHARAVRVVPGVVGNDGAVGPATFGEPAQALRQALLVAQTMLVLEMALSEAVSLLGFVLNRLGAPPAQFLPFLAAGTVLAALRFPTASHMLGPYERAHGASFAPSMDTPV